jgi:hypothetical protein
MMQCSCITHSCPVPFHSTRSRRLSGLKNQRVLLKL